MEEGKQIYQHLLYGDLRKISAETGYSVVTVWKHLNGQIKKVNPVIINKALDFVEKRNKERQDLDDRLKKVLPNVN